MKQDSTLTRNLAASQERHAAETLARQTAERAALGSASTIVRIYTESIDADETVIALTERYFPNGATIFPATGIWAGGREQSTVIEIVCTPADFQRVADLAGDIRVVNHQQSVLVCYVPGARRFDVNDRTINGAAL